MQDVARFRNSTKLTTMCVLVQTVVLSWLFLKIAVAINLTCDTVSPAVQSDVTCVCKRTSGTSIDWLFDDTLNSNCELFFNCIPKKTGYNYFINSTENFYEITIMSYSYSDCTKVTCKDASDGNIKQSVVPSSITFDSTYPTSLSEPSASHINGTISVTTGCISGYSGVKYVWYTISDGLEETYSPDPKSIFDTTDTSTCVNCSINDINGNRTIGFEHREASGDNTKNVNFRVVLSHESTNSIINLTSSQSYTVKGINESSVSNNVTSIPHTTPTSANKSKATTSEKYGIPSSISSIAVVRKSTIVTTEKYQKEAKYAVLLYIGLAWFVVISIVVMICYTCCYFTMNKRKTNKNKSHENDQQQNVTDTSQTSHF